MKTITYNPETHVLVPREPSEEMCDAATADSCWENMNPPPSTAYRLMLSAAPQPEPNHNWCAGCSPDNCSGCGVESVESEPAMWVMKHIRSGDLAQAKPNQKALHPYMLSDAFPRYTTPQPDRTAELEAALKEARDGIDEFLVANDPTEFGCACDLSVGYLCGPCHADKRAMTHKEEIALLRSELATIKAENESLRKDASRLDWVEHQDFHDLSFAILVDQPNDGMTAVSISEGWHLGNNLREAIDAAMIAGDKNVLD